MKSQRGYLNETCKVLSLDEVVSFQVDLPQLTGSHRVVLRVKLIKAVKGLSPL